MAGDAVIIGGGHNGLVCAALLARRGRKVTVLEAADRLGGAATTREFAPGFLVSAGAHLLHQMARPLIEELDLARHGLAFAAEGMPSWALAEDGHPLRLDEAPEAAALRDRLGRFARTLAPILGRTPPRLGTDAWADRLGLLGLAWRIRRLGRRDMRELLRILGMNIHDLLEEQLETPLLKGAFAFDAVLGSNFGPRSPGTVLTLLYRLAAAAEGGGLAQPKGGMAALAEALGRAAQAAGATVRTGARVRRILVEQDRAAGVALESGEVVPADAVISNADPRTTFLELLGARHLDAGFVRRVSHLRSRGLAAKLHLALDGLPSFRGLPAEALGGRLLIAPSADHVERAYNHAKYGEFSAEPVLELTLPTVADPDLAPRGRHVLSAIVQYAPYDLADGWEIGRDRLTDLAIATIERHAPGLRRLLRSAELLSPVDLERLFGMTGGHWHHGELAFDQFFMVRPVPGATQYRTPLDGLYLCGAGSHPGGGVTGLAGRNAALEILKAA